MIRRALYFLLGAAFVCAVVATVVLWDSYHDFQIALRCNHMLQQRLWRAEDREIHPNELVGTWHGEESWGSTFDITRNSDGTFSEVMDVSHYDAHVHTDPVIIRSKGHWSVSGSRYARYYTQSTRPSRVGAPPEITRLTSVTPTEIEYFWSEGDGVMERRK